MAIKFKRKIGMVAMAIGSIFGLFGMAISTFAWFISASKVDGNGLNLNVIEGNGATAVAYYAYSSGNDHSSSSYSGQAFSTAFTEVTSFSKKITLDYARFTYAVKIQFSGTSFSSSLTDWTTTKRSGYSINAYNTATSSWVDADISWATRIYATAVATSTVPSTSDITGHFNKLSSTANDVFGESITNTSDSYSLASVASKGTNDYVYLFISLCFNPSSKGLFKPVTSAYPGSTTSGSTSSYTQYWAPCTSNSTCWYMYRGMTFTLNTIEVTP